MKPKSPPKKRIGCRTWILIVLGVVILGAIVSPKKPAGVTPAPSPMGEGRGEGVTPSPTPQLPPHTVAKNNVLPNGRRIEIHVDDPALTKDQCRALLAAYRDQAGPAGQISVRKPDKTGEQVPWCVDNLDGRPVIFNDDLFKETSGKVDITIELPTRSPESWPTIPVATAVSAPSRVPKAGTAGRASNGEVQGGGHIFTNDRVDPPWWPCTQGQIKGNLNSKIYHNPTGRDYSKTYDNVRCFDTAEDAQAAGFRAAKR